MATQNSSLYSVLTHLIDNMSKSLLDDQVWGRYISTAVRLDDMLLRLRVWMQDIQGAESLPLIEERSTVLSTALKLCTDDLTKIWDDLKQSINDRPEGTEQETSQLLDNFASLVIDLTSQVEPIRSILDEETTQELLQKLQQKYPGKRKMGDLGGGKETLNMTECNLITWHDDEQAEVDIVFVHGLCGGGESTWTKDGVVWPKELLSKDIPKSRILSFDYDSSVIHSNTAEVTQGNLADDARQLCNLLVEKRKQTSTTERRIVVIGHSFGGLVLAQVVYGGNETVEGDSTRLIAQHIKGMIFLGTPFCKSRKSGWGEIMLRICKLVEKTDKQTIRRVRLDSDALKGLRFGFPEVIRKRDQTSDKVALVFFFEKERTYGEWIVNEEEASYPSLGQVLPIQANHLDLCKFGDAKDDGYKQVSGKIKQVMEATDVTEARTEGNTYTVSGSGIITNFAQGDMDINQQTSIIDR